MRHPAPPPLDGWRILECEWNALRFALTILQGRWLEDGRRNSFPELHGAAARNPYSHCRKLHPHGEPVGSATLARLQVLDGNGNVISMSPATIRNEMAELADAGLLEQPHTSAGRIPTAQAFRLYVEQLSGGATPRIAPARLSATSRSQIDSSFVGLAGTQAVLQRTSHVLATLSSGVGVAIAAAATATCWSMFTFRALQRPAFSPSSSRNPAWCETAFSPLTATFRFANLKPPQTSSTRTFAAGASSASAPRSPAWWSASATSTRSC